MQKFILRKIIIIFVLFFFFLRKNLFKQEEIIRFDKSYYISCKLLSLW